MGQDALADPDRLDQRVVDLAPVVPPETLGPPLGMFRLDRVIHCGKDTTR
jgi:hypothetical protein